MSGSDDRELYWRGRVQEYAWINARLDPQFPYEAPTEAGSRALLSYPASDEEPTPEWRAPYRRTHESLISNAWLEEIKTPRFPCYRRTAYGDQWVAHLKRWEEALWVMLEAEDTIGNIMGIGTAESKERTQKYVPRHLKVVE